MRWGGGNTKNEAITMKTMVRRCCTLAEPTIAKRARRRANPRKREDEAMSGLSLPGGEEY